MTPLLNSQCKNKLEIRESIFINFQSILYLTVKYIIVYNGLQCYRWRSTLHYISHEVIKVLLENEFIDWIPIIMI